MEFTKIPDSTRERLMSIPEYCEVFGHPKPHILRRAIKTGVIPAYTIGGTKWLVKPSEVLATAKRLQTMEAQNV